MSRSHDRGNFRHPGQLSRRGFAAVVCLAAVSLTAACSHEPRTARWARGTDSLPGRQVWGHLVPQGLPLSDDEDVSYGSERPLTFAAHSTSYDELVESQLQQARKAGMTGMQILQLEDVNVGSDFVVDWMTAADPTWRGGEGFAVAPCIQVTSRQGAESLIRQYVQAAQGRSSAARIDDALVVWVYDARALPPQQWVTCRQNLERDGIHVYLIGELRTASSQHGNSLDEDAIDPYAGLFEAVWLFDDHGFLIMPGFAEWARRHDMAFAGGVLPGYNRETPNGGYVDPRATALWREQWEQQQDSGASWATAVTWNDVVEHTAVQPTSDWGTTRADLAAFYSAKFRGSNLSRREPELYVTSPQFVIAGDPVLAEGLVVNAGGNPVTVRLRVTTGAGKDVVSPVTARAAEGTVAAATTEEAVRLTPGTAVYAVAELEDTSGHVTSTVQGAPILVYASDDDAVPQPRRRTYYSLAAGAAAPFDDLVDATTTTLEQAGASPPVLMTRHQVSALELLHNTWPAGLALEASRVTYAEPPQSIVGGQKISTPPYGYTVARIITADGSIAYSPPVYRPASPENKG